MCSVWYFVRFSVATQHAYQRPLTIDWKILLFIFISSLSSLDISHFAVVNRNRVHEASARNRHTTVYTWSRVYFFLHAGVGDSFRYPLGSQYLIHIHKKCDGIRFATICASCWNQMKNVEISLKHFPLSPPSSLAFALSSTCSAAAAADDDDDATASNAQSIISST